MVVHPKTNQAQSRLASEIRQELFPSCDYSFGWQSLKKMFAFLGYDLQILSSCLVGFRLPGDVAPKRNMSRLWMWGRPDLPTQLWAGLLNGTEATSWMTQRIRALHVRRMPIFVHLHMFCELLCFWSLRSLSTASGMTYPQLLRYPAYREARTRTHTQSCR